MALEGSADEVIWWQGDIVAVSSVYDIEQTISSNRRYGVFPQAVIFGGLNGWTNDLGPSFKPKASCSPGWGALVVVTSMFKQTAFFPY